MTLPKIKNFTDYNHYPSDPQPTTDADMQDYMLNQNDILTALTKRLWQPQTAYNLGDIVASDAMADGLVAVCTIAGVTSDIEPTWGVNEATVIDNSCTWIMRPAYCYGLATDGDVQTVYDGGEAEVSRLLSLGVLDKIFEIFKGRIGELFGDNDVLPIANGGTGQTTAADVIKALFGSSAIGSAGQPVYYDGTNIKAGSYNFRLSHNTSDTRIPVFSSGNIDYVLKDEIANTWTGGGIVAASLNTNGYVKFANGLILQWGYVSGSSRPLTATLPISCAVYMAVTCVNNQGTPGDANAYWISGNTIYLYGHGGGSGKTYIVIGK